MTDYGQIVSSHPWFRKYLAVYSVDRREWLEYQAKRLEKQDKIFFPGGMGIIKNSSFLSRFFGKSFSDFTMIREEEGLDPMALLETIKEIIRLRGLSHLALKVPEEFRTGMLLEGISIIPVITSRKMVMTLSGRTESPETEGILKGASFPRDFLAQVSREYGESRFHYDPGFRKKDISDLFLTWLENSLKDPCVTALLDPGKGLLLLKTHDILKSRIGEILFIHVLSKARNSGTGRRLINRGLSELCSSRCGIAEVKLTAENSGAELFYEKIGFSKFLDEKTYHFGSKSVVRVKQRG
ncbi:MAG TPA: GNAT family N-acetyltransferase [bacterium]|nr:GNAT family N-acetyltransferase [bacterium]